jgi:hypothetical protein
MVPYLRAGVLTRAKSGGWRPEENIRGLLNNALHVFEIKDRRTAPPGRWVLEPIIAWINHSWRLAQARAPTLGSFVPDVVTSWTTFGGQSLRELSAKNGTLADRLGDTRTCSGESRIL